LAERIAITGSQGRFLSCSTFLFQTNSGQYFSLLFFFIKVRALKIVRGRTIHFGKWELLSNDRKDGKIELIIYDGQE